MYEARTRSFGEPAKSSSPFCITIPGSGKAGSRAPSRPGDRIPPGMVEMEVGAHHQIDVFRLKTQRTGGHPPIGWDPRHYPLRRCP